MTAHWQGSDQRLYGENSDVLLAQCVWNVGQFANPHVFWPYVILFPPEQSSRSHCVSAKQLLCSSSLCQGLCYILYKSKNIWKCVTFNRFKVNHKVAFNCILLHLIVLYCNVDFNVNAPFSVCFIFFFFQGSVGPAGKEGRQGEKGSKVSN